MAVTKKPRYWHELTTYDFDALDKDGVVAVLPVGATEQHGPHLPVLVDAGLNKGIVDKAVSLLPQELDVLVLPAQPIGKSDEHAAFPGTLTLSTETLIRVWTEIGECVARAGIRRLLIFNSHGGQPQVADIVARDLRVRLGMFVVTTAWWQLDQQPGLFSDAEMKHGIHGGAVETSMMLHLHPDLVRMDKAQNFVSLSALMENEYRLLTPEGGVGFGWQAQDLNPLGACGDATLADAAKGEQLVDGAAAGLVELLGEIARYPLENVRSRETLPKP